MPKPLEKRLHWEQLRQRYGRASLKNKSNLLNELVDLTGMNRKYLIRKLGY